MQAAATAEQPTKTFLTTAEELVAWARERAGGRKPPVTPKLVIELIQKTGDHLVEHGLMDKMLRFDEVPTIVQRALVRAHEYTREDLGKRITLDQRCLRAGLPKGVDDVFKEDQSGEGAYALRWVLSEIDDEIMRRVTKHYTGQPWRQEPGARLTTARKDLDAADDRFQIVITALKTLMPQLNNGSCHLSTGVRAARGFRRGGDAAFNGALEPLTAYHLIYS